ncbi:MAG: hypothetical protein ACKN9E_15225 [Microcystaceae cyanobacterium]
MVNITYPKYKIGESVATIAQAMQANGQVQIAQDIKRLKAMGEPIYYSVGKKLIREESDGRKYEYRLREDGSEEILDEAQ